jgi:L-fuculose-phosphate aldolase
VACRRFAASGLTLSTWGNISVRDSTDGSVHITPSGMDYTTLTAGDMVAMDIAGAVIAGTRTPSTEAALHLAVYRARGDVAAIVHTHSLYATVFAASGREIPVLTDEAAQALGGVVRVARYALPGSAALAEACVEALGAAGVACLLRSHGAVCVGGSLDEAFRATTVLEVTAHIYAAMLAAGLTPAEMRADDIATMRDFALHRYGQRRGDGN